MKDLVKEMTPLMIHGLKGCSARRKRLCQKQQEDSDYRLQVHTETKTINLGDTSCGVITKTGETKIKMFGHYDERYICRGRIKQKHWNQVFTCLKILRN